MIAKLEWTLRNVQQNIEQLQTPTMEVTKTTSQQQQNHLNLAIQLRTQWF